MLEDESHQRQIMQLIYWSSTVLVSIALLLSSISYIFHQATIDGVRDLGFPDSFRIQLAVLKLIAVVILLVPTVPHQIKEWAYVGAVLFYITAIVAHWAHKDPFYFNLINLFFIGLLVVSNIYLQKL